MGTAAAATAAAAAAVAAAACLQAPECFYIEKEAQRRMNIPVVSYAALRYMVTACCRRTVPAAAAVAFAVAFDWLWLADTLADMLIDSPFLFHLSVP
jgi:hypothetical protein